MEYWVFFALYGLILQIISIGFEFMLGSKLTKAKKIFLQYTQVLMYFTKQLGR